MFASPIGYSLRFKGSILTPLLALNPMIGIIEGFRWAVAATPPPGTETLLTAVAVTLLFCAMGFVQFAAMERTFADVV